MYCSRFDEYIWEFQELLTFPENLGSPPIFSGVRVARSLFFCEVFCISLFVLLSIVFWLLCCLSLDLWIMITPLVSSNSSFKLFDIVWHSIGSVMVSLLTSSAVDRWFETQSGQPKSYKIGICNFSD